MARNAALRLVGLRLDEVTRSEEHRDGDGHVTSSEHWVEIHGKLFVEDAFLEPAIPTTLEPGATLGGSVRHPGSAARPADGPSRRVDHRLGAGGPLGCPPRPRPLRGDAPAARPAPGPAAGGRRQAGRRQPPGQGVPVGDAMISVTSPLPAPAGTEMTVYVRWPSAPGGQKGRVELHRRTNAPNGAEGIIASAPIDPATLAGGVDVALAVPAGSAPSFDGAGLEIDYVIRVLVDRRFRTDAAIERPVGIV